MYVLDTNIISALITKRRNSLNLSRRILVEPLENLFVSIITVEEILSGYLSAIHRSRHLPTVINRYRELEELLTDLQQFQILPYTQQADGIYRSMTAQQRRVGTQDCRIAATAIALGYTVITANTTDFIKLVV